ncbi:MAG: 3-keto-5-aminohexanoate cleavage protein [Deltaproteobacteria bacterium]|nr:MAG: 3-keto-5-aminohexanoate cleavage protein [Deltaproteobacteria bacterium]
MHQENTFVMNFAPTGMVPKRKDNPHVPISPQEIADQVQEATELGITIVHLHARDLDEQPSHDIDLYAEIIQRVRRFAPELVICVSLSGRLKPDFTSRATPLQLTGELKPDMGSLTLSSLNFSRQASMNAPQMIQQLAGEMLRLGVVPELEAFDGGMVNYGLYLIKKGLINPPFYFNLIFGNPFNAQADPLTFGAILTQLPQQSLWGVGGIGNAQTPSATMGLAAGGGVRIGLEDNLFYDQERTTLATNINLLKRVHRIAEELGQQAMSPKTFREKMEMQPGNGAYGRKVER